MLQMKKPLRLSRDLRFALATLIVTCMVTTIAWCFPSEPTGVAKIARVANPDIVTTPVPWSGTFIAKRVMSPIRSALRMRQSEIDVMEVPKPDGTLNHAVHWDGNAKEHQVQGSESKVPGVIRRWAPFSLLWAPESYVFYVNGKETWRSSAGGVCQVPVYAMLSTEIGSWVVAIDEQMLPDRFVVDYVRVYDHGNSRATKRGPS